MASSTLGSIRIFYRFLFLVSILEPTIVALPWVTRRGTTTWDDSPGQAIIDGGAAGFGVLNDIWNELIEPSTTENENLPPDQIQIQSQPESSTNTPPELSSPPIFGPNMRGQCSAFFTQSLGSAADDQLPGTGNGDILTPPDGSTIPGPSNEEEYEGYIQQSTKTG